MTTDVAKCCKYVQIMSNNVNIIHSHCMHHHVSDFKKKTFNLFARFQGVKVSKKDPGKHGKHTFLLHFCYAAGFWSTMSFGPCRIICPQHECGSMFRPWNTSTKPCKNLPSLLQYGLPFVHSAKEVPWVCHHSKTHKLTVSKRCHGNDMKCMDIMSCEPTRFRKLMVCSRLHVQPHH